jgi:hypothetical protein
MRRAGMSLFLVVAFADTGSAGFSGRLACTSAVRDLDSYYKAKCKHLVDNAFAHRTLRALQNCKSSASRKDAMRIVQDFAEDEHMHMDLCDGARRILDALVRKEFWKHNFFQKTT